MKLYLTVRVFHGGNDSAVVSPSGFGDVEKCGYL